MVEIGEKKIPAPRECPLSQSSRGAGIFLPLSVDSGNDFSPKEAARIYGLENVALRKFFFLWIRTYFSVWNLILH